MITVDVDAHKKIHVGLALDEFGRETNHWQPKASAAGTASGAGWRVSAKSAESALRVPGAMGVGSHSTLLLLARPSTRSTPVGPPLDEEVPRRPPRPTAWTLTPSLSTSIGRLTGYSGSRAKMRQPFSTCWPPNAKQRSLSLRGCGIRFTPCCFSSTESTNAPFRR